MTCPACGATYGMPAGEWGDEEVALLDQHIDDHLAADEQPIVAIAA